MNGPVYRVKNAMAAASGAKLSNRAWRLFVTLATYTNLEGQCWPSRAELQARSGLSRRQLQYATVELIEAGLLVVDVKPPRSNRYQLDPLALSTDRAWVSAGTDVRTAPERARSPRLGERGDRAWVSARKNSLKGQRRGAHPYPCCCDDCVAFIEERRA